MKKIALTTVALLGLTGLSFAADLPMNAPPPMVVPVAVYNWSGFYIGGHIGWGWSNIGSTELDPGTNAFPTGTVFNGHHLSGVLGGVQAGVNWQASNNFVLGFEGEYSWADLNGMASTISIAPRFVGFTSTSTDKTKDIALATGRLGYAANNWLFYVKGGGAWTQGNSSGTGFLANGTTFDTFTSSTNRSGWVVGGGVEWGFAPNWSAKIEYDYIDLGSTTVAIHSVTNATNVATTSFVRSSDTINVVKAGVNYRFNWGGPVVAHY
jgi:outer membrane immunogenic protein